MIIILLTLIFIIIPDVAISQPMIYFDSEKHNFGKVDKLELEHVFEFINKGDEELVIDRLVPSWGGCSAELVGSENVKPGETRKIIARMHIKEGWRGPVARNIRVISNDPKRPVVLLILYANVQ